MDNLFIVQLIMAGLFLLGLFIALSARIEVGRLSTRMTMLEDRFQQLLVLLAAETRPSDRHGEEGSG